MKTDIKQLKETITKIYNLAVNEKKYLAPMVWGAPGIGKSSVIKQISDELGIGFIDLRLSLLNPVDLRGLPTINKEERKAEWLQPEFLPTEPNDKAKNSKGGILFLDEINLAPQSVMSAGYQLILDRKLGNYTLPDNWIIIGAGNRAEDKANVTRFPAPLANRFIHLDMEDPDDERWRKWALRNGINEKILAFIGKFPQHIYKFPKTGEKAWPSPRSWEFASNLHYAGLRIDSAVGEGVASEFYQFLKVYNRIPDIEKILEGKETMVPQELDVLWATSMSIVFKAQEKHIENVFSYIRQEKFPKEFEVRTIIDLSEKSDQMRNSLVKSKSWENWRKENVDIVEGE